MPETIIITGASGFVGRHLLEDLLIAGYNIIAIDYCKNEYLENLCLKYNNRLTFFQLDFTNPKALEKIKEEFPNDSYLIHLGAYILSSCLEVSQYDIQRSIDTNISGSLNLVKILKTKLNGVCLASTLDVYGIPKILPIDQDHPLNPQTFYAASKLAMEFYLKLELQKQIPLTILRFSHIYGLNDPHKKVLQAFIEAVNLDKAPIIYGDGSDLRDYINIRDIINSIRCALKIKTIGIFNVASGISLSLKDLAELVIKISGKKLSPVYMERKEVKKDYIFNINKIKTVLGFTPKISLSEGIEELIDIPIKIQS